MEDLVEIRCLNVVKTDSLSNHYFLIIYCLAVSKEMQFFFGLVTFQVGTIESSIHFVLILASLSTNEFQNVDDIPNFYIL